MADQIKYIGKLHSCTRALPLNMVGKDPYFAYYEDRVRCPRCKQYHLRAGYCQALDPINQTVTLPSENVTQTVTDPKKRNAERQKRYRERKKRR